MSQALILDLDETLLHTYVSGETPPSLAQQRVLGPAYYQLEIASEIYWGVMRPGWQEFLAYCEKRFVAVGFWSAGTQAYVQALAAILPLPRNTVFVRSRDHCDQLPREERDASGSLKLVTSLCKPLQSLGSCYYQFARNRTWIVDDRRDYASENLLNWLKIPPFEPSNPLERSDTYLSELARWFESPGVRDTTNVLLVNKNWY